MLALLPSALAFRITGAELHEILGLATVAAFALHNILNRAWYRSLGRGRYNADRSAGTAVVAAIAACAAACAVSGVALSGFVFGLSDRFGGLGIRAVHTTSAYWTFVLCGVHVGLRAGFLRFLPKIASAAVFCAGAYFFVSRGMPENFSRGRLSIFTKCHLPPISARRRRFFSPRRSARAPCGNSCGGGDFQGAKKCGLQRQTALGSGIAALSFWV